MGQPASDPLPAAGPLEKVCRVSLSKLVLTHFLKARECFVRAPCPQLVGHSLSVSLLPLALGVALTLALTLALALVLTS